MRLFVVGAISNRMQVEPWEFFCWFFAVLAEKNILKHSYFSTIVFSLYSVKVCISSDIILRHVLLNALKSSWKSRVKFSVIRTETLCIGITNFSSTIQVISKDRYRHWIGKTLKTKIHILHRAYYQSNRFVNRASPISNKA